MTCEQMPTINRSIADENINAILNSEHGRYIITDRRQKGFAKDSYHSPAH